MTNRANYEFEEQSTKNESAAFVYTDRAIESFH